MKHLFGFSTHELFQSTFRSLTDFWATIPTPENSSDALPAPSAESYTTYAHPIEVDGEVIMLKTDLDRPSRLVALDPATGQERTLCYTGIVATRPIYAGFVTCSIFPSAVMRAIHIPSSPVMMQ